MHCAGIRLCSAGILRAVARASCPRRSCPSGADRNGNYHSYQYNPQDRLWWAGYLTASYDGAGHLSQITDGLNGTWNFTYDNMGRLTQTRFLRPPLRSALE